MVGSIDSRYGITMSYKKNGYQITGSYSYLASGKPLALRGTIDKLHNVLLKEFNSVGTNTGTFKGQILEGKRFVGTWTNEKNHETLPFLLALDNDAKALAGGKNGIIITQATKTYMKPKGKCPPGLAQVLINYPIVMAKVLDNPLIAKQIQDALSLKHIFDQSAEEMIADVKSGYYWLDEVTYCINYNQDYLIDADFTMSGTSAYSSVSTKHVLINTKTGKVVRAKDAFYRSSFKQLKAMLQEKIDAESKSALKKHVNITNDPESLQILKQLFTERGIASDNLLNTFAISKTGITFIHYWGFPHIMLAAEPEGRYFFSYKTLKPFISKDGSLAGYI